MLYKTTHVEHSNFICKVTIVVKGQSFFYVTATPPPKSKNQSESLISVINYSYTVYSNCTWFWGSLIVIHFNSRIEGECLEKCDQFPVEHITVITRHSSRSSRVSLSVTFIFCFSPPLGHLRGTCLHAKSPLYQCHLFPLKSQIATANKATLLLICGFPESNILSDRQILERFHIMFA